MALPIATTTFTVEAHVTSGDYYDGATVSTVTTGLRGHLDVGYRGTGEDLSGGRREVIHAKLHADPYALDSSHVLVDETTGQRWQVLWVEPREHLGLGHVEGLVRQVTGTGSED